MKMNFLESTVMNSLFYSGIKRWYELPRLARLGGRLDGMRVLEIGCGNGLGTALLLDQLGASEVHAFDLDEKMIARAKHRLRTYPEKRVTLWVGDANAIESSAEHYDAVVNFAVLHHIPDWQAAVAEIARVLKWGGTFIFEDVTAQWIRRWPWKQLFRHPQENRFSAAELLAELERRGLSTGTHYEVAGKGDFIFGAARKIRRHVCDRAQDHEDGTCSPVLAHRGRPSTTCGPTDPGTEVFEPRASA